MEFEEKYKGTGVDPNGLIENWTKYREQLQRALSDHRKNEFQTQWDLSVHNFFILIQLFPSKQVGRNVTASSVNFEASIRKLVQFELVIISSVYKCTNVFFIIILIKHVYFHLLAVYATRSNGCRLKKLSHYRCLWRFRKRN